MLFTVGRLKPDVDVRGQAFMAWITSEAAMRIGELAGKAGVSVRALRYYEEQHLLASERSPSGQRHYPDSAVDRVRFIQRLYRAGLPSKAIAQILPCLLNAPATPRLLQRLQDERDRLDRQIDQLLTARDRLDAGIRKVAVHAAEGTRCSLPAQS
jgi:DNA-binding transcriptional MerR regulator